MTIVEESKKNNCPPHTLERVWYHKDIVPWQSQRAYQDVSILELEEVTIKF
jgi:hypothetical protein